jgi:ABC-type multidrug transport system fused ATPase/permease subunit
MKKIFFKNNMLSFGVTLVFTVLQGVLMLGISMILKIMINTISGTGGKTLKEITVMIMLFLGCLSISYIFICVFKPRFIKKALINYKNEVMDHVLKKKQFYLKEEDTSMLLSGLTNDLNTIETNYLEANFSLIKDLIYFIGAISIMLYTSYTLTGIVILLIILPMAASMITGRSLVPAEKDVSGKNADYVALLKDCFQGFSVIKSFQAEKEILNVVNLQNDTLEKSKCKRNIIKILVGMIGMITSLFAQFGIFFAGVWMVVTGQGIDAGTVLLFVNLMNFIVTPIAEIPSILSSKKAAEALIDKMSDHVKEEKERSGGVEAPNTLVKGIILKDVSFGYEEDNTVLDKISLEFKPGKSYAIVGSSGSGKTTLLNLIKGSDDVYKGEIKYDDIELKNIEKGSLAKLISDIEQEVFVFDATIEDNIKMFKNFPREALDIAEKKANIEDIIIERGQGFMCGENGKHLSGGEKQRISIARSILKNAQVIIADEPWSSLDKQNAFDISKEIVGIKDSIRIVVTHLLDKDILSQYDTIIAMRNGKIVEMGTYDNLIESDGYFRALCKMGLY